MDRFNVDLVGASSGKNAADIRIHIVFKSGESLNLGVADKTAATPVNEAWNTGTMDSRREWRIYGFLEKSEMMHLDGGIYRA